MKILYAASESGPFIRTGGLGDVAAALPNALSAYAEVRVIMPLYEDIPSRFKDSLVHLGSITVPLGWRNQYAGLFSGIYNNVTYYFVDNEYYFKRKGLYGFFDDGERFAFFSRAILELMPLMNFYPDVLHANDWQTALVPVMLDAFYRDAEEYKNIKTVLTIHNIEFQGNMDAYCIKDVFGLPDSHYNVAEYRNNANMLKAGIEAANRVTTVSPTYAEEILDAYYAYGLEDILRSRKYKLSGIVNGIDTTLYDPLKDKALFQKYSVRSIGRKAKNRAGLQELLGLPVADKPLIAMVTRLTTQKGIDLLLAVIDEVLHLDLQLVVLGTGDLKYENMLREISSRYPTKLAAIINFSQDLASKIYAGSDMFLMPSKFEPCGLSQLLAMRYGSIPIVRETGGLKDTVLPFNPETGEGTGFSFKTYNAYDMLDAIGRAYNTYQNPELWAKLVKNAMSNDTSWKQSAKSYVALYQSLL
ncbi:MAG: glycogen synthase GlgA [Clostridia bacterium]